MTASCFCIQPLEPKNRLDASLMFATGFPVVLQLVSHSRNYLLYRSSRVKTTNNFKVAAIAFNASKRHYSVMKL